MSTKIIKSEELEKDLNTRKVELESRQTKWSWVTQYLGGIHPLFRNPTESDVLKFSQQRIHDDEVRLNELRSIRERFLG